MEERMVPGGRILLRGALGAVAVAGLWLSAVAAGPAAAAEDARALFLANKCNTCHSVASAGIESKVKKGKKKGPDLGGLDKSPEWVLAFVHQREKLDGKEHQKEFKGDDADIPSIVAWLSSLEAAAP